MTNKQLKAIFDHEVFQKDWKSKLRDVAIDEYGNELTVLKNHRGVITTYEDGLYFASKLTFIPSVEQLRKMSGPEMKWRIFYFWCQQKWEDEYFINDNDIDVLLAAAMVVMAQRGFKWQGYEKGWVKK